MCVCVFVCIYIYIYFFFFNDTATTEIYTLSLHDALPISRLDSTRLDSTRLDSTLGNSGSLGVAQDTSSVFCTIGVILACHVRSSGRGGRLGSTFVLLVGMGF